MESMRIAFAFSCFRLTVSVVSLVALVNGNCPRAEPLLKTPDLQRVRTYLQIHH